MGIESKVLLQRHKDGDSEALNELLSRYYPRVERIIQVRVGPTLAAKVQVEDILQEVMLTAAKNIDHFEPREDAYLINWMARLAENTIRGKARFHRAERRDAGRELHLGAVHRRAAESAAELDVPGADTAVPDRVVRKEGHERLNACIAQLKPEYREVILLRQYAGGSWAFVAKEMKSPSEAAAQKTYERARAELKKRLGRHLD